MLIEYILRNIRSFWNLWIGIRTLGSNNL